MSIRSEWSLLQKCKPKVPKDGKVVGISRHCSTAGIRHFQVRSHLLLSNPASTRSFSLSPIRGFNKWGVLRPVAVLSNLYWKMRFSGWGILGGHQVYVITLPGVTGDYTINKYRQSASEAEKQIHGGSGTLIF